MHSRWLKEVSLVKKNRDKGLGITPLRQFSLFSQFFVRFSFILHTLWLPDEISRKKLARDTGRTMWPPFKTRRSTNWWSNAKPDVTHPTATVVYDAGYHLFRKCSCIPMYRLALANWPWQQYDTSHLWDAQKYIVRKPQSANGNNSRR